MEQEWILFLRKKFSLTSLELEEYIVSFDYFNNGKPITPALLSQIAKICFNEKILEWEAAKIIEDINNLVRPNEDLPIEIDLNTYLLFIIPLTTNIHRQRIKIGQLFKHFDKDGDGLINNNELIEVLLKISKTMPPDQFKKHYKKICRMIKKADKDGNGYLNEEEFTKLVKENKIKL